MKPQTESQQPVFHLILILHIVAIFTCLASGVFHRRQRICWYPFRSTINVPHSMYSHVPVHCSLLRSQRPLTIQSTPQTLQTNCSSTSIPPFDFNGIRTSSNIFLYIYFFHIIFFSLYLSIPDDFALFFGRKRGMENNLTNNLRKLFVASSTLDKT